MDTFIYVCGIIFLIIMVIAVIVGALVLFLLFDDLYSQIKNLHNDYTYLTTRIKDLHIKRDTAAHRIDHKLRTRIRVIEQKLGIESEDNNGSQHP